MSVTKAVAGVSGVKDVDVSLEKGEAVWTEAAPVDVDAVKAAIRKAGFDVE
jgi:copper chaperone